MQKKAVIEQKDYHFLTGTLSEVAKNRYCVEILGPARPDQASGGKKKLPPSSPSNSVAPIPEIGSPIPEEEPSEVISNPLDISQPLSTKEPENASTRGTSSHSENEYAQTTKQIEKQHKKKANRKRKNRTRVNDEDVGV
ncbi:hypothetical protein ACTXT7_007658 [Hymenolepis weldensis]